MQTDTRICAGSGCDAEVVRPGSRGVWPKWCAECKSERQSQQNRANQKRIRQRDPEAARRKSRERARANPEANRLRANEWYHANRERAAQQPSRQPDAVRERWRKNGRRYYLKSKYGITPEQFDTMFESQNGRCAICRREGERPTGQARHDRESWMRGLVVDHCHDSGEVRALLCQHCNSGIGLLRDNPELLRVAADYLECHRQMQEVAV